MFNYLDFSELCYGNKIRRQIVPTNIVLSCVKTQRVPLMLDMTPNAMN